MFSSRSAIGRVWFLAAVITTAFAASPPSSVLVYSTDGYGLNFTLALNVPSSGNDLYFHMSVPNQQSWVAFGLGASMSDSPLIFLAYRSADGKNVTISPRLAQGRSEPQHDPVKDVTVTVLEGSGITSGTYGSMVINAKCGNCRRWSGNELDVQSRQQPMIFATYANGDNGDRSEKPLQSDDLNAHIQQHTGEQQFTMDMVQATGTGGLPVGPFAKSSGVNVSGEDEADDRHLARIFHALLMLGSFLLLFPLGVLWLRVLEKVWMHWINQALASFCIVVAAIIGITISVKQKISPKLTSPHQIIGLVAVALVLIQLTLGFVHHRMYLAKGTPTPLGKIHRYSGPLVVCLGLANGFIGFHFADNNRYQITYGLLILIVGLTLVGALLLKKRRQRRKVAMTSTAAQNFNSAYAPSQSNGDIPLRENAAPQPFGGQNQPYYGPPPGGRF